MIRGEVLSVDDDLKDVLQRLLNEIEDLRAHQVLTTVRLSTAPSLAVTDIDDLKAQALEKNAGSYAEVRQTIAAL
jgi:hypothetical protein